MKKKKEFAIATSRVRNAKHWQPGTVTWEEVIGWLDDPATSKACGNYVMGTLGPCNCTVAFCKCSGGDCGHLARNKRSIISRSMLALDVDAPDPDFMDKVEMLFPHALLAHSTYSSTPDKPRYRLLVPLDEEATPVEYHAMAAVVMDDLGMHQFDPGSVEPERYMFRPSAQRPEWFYSLVLDGPALPVAEYLARFDPSVLPTPVPSRNKRNPYELHGVVGAFNRAYDIQNVIEEYALPYEMETEERWHLVGAKGAAGVSLVQPGLVYSHHVNDPASGQACSAFDLVRLHRFGDLDEHSPEKTPLNRLPSTVAMQDLASKDVHVVEEIVGGDFSTITDNGVPDSTPNWRGKLSISPRTGMIQNVVANWDLIRANDTILSGIYFNEMTMAIETEDDLPWRTLDKGGQALNHVDRMEFRMHLEREYGAKASREQADEMVETRARQRWINPVRDYLETLEWDGVPRLEESLPGVTPTDYTRMVARKVLTAAVARMLRPGIKWDHTLIIFGEEGIGKTWWVGRMARGFSASLGRVGDKDTLLTMRRSWIMVSDEGFTLRKGDSDAQKEFLTRTEDVFRMPYEREAQAYPRHCVVWGTTNDEVFLRRQEGNRRYLIVHADTPVDFDAMTEEYVDQVWAEAVHLFNAGEPLYLSPLDSMLAATSREDYTEEDALAGIIQAWADTPVPEEWHSMSRSQRYQWRTDYRDGMVPEGESTINEVCTAQVWVEVLGNRLGEHRRTDLLEIGESLKRMGWKTTTGKRRFMGYGPQIVFTRPEGLRSV